jgi:hypothetical protein
MDNYGPPENFNKRTTISITKGTANKLIVHEPVASVDANMLVTMDAEVVYENQ